MLRKFLICNLIIFMEKKEKFNFSKAASKLEDITSSFERDEFELEEGIEKFEEGLKIAKKLEARLKEAENEIKEIKIKFSKMESEEDDDHDPEPE